MFSFILEGHFGFNTVCEAPFPSNRTASNTLPVIIDHPQQEFFKEYKGNGRSLSVAMSQWLVLQRDLEGQNSPAPMDS